ncbi:MAG: META domain-containing protein [Bacteroidia bacterium]
MKHLQYLGLLWAVIVLYACNPDRKEVTSNDWIPVNVRLNSSDSLRTTSNIYTMSFEGRRNFNLQLTVNTCGGKVEFKPNNVVLFNDIGCTEACCDSEFAGMVLEVLKNVNRYQFNEEFLNMSGNNGEEISFIRK